MAKSKPETQQQQYRHGLLLLSWALGSHLLAAEYINPVVQFRYHCWIYLLHFNDIFATKASHMLIVNTARNQARALTKFKFEALHILSLLPYSILGHTLNLIRIYRYHIPLTLSIWQRSYPPKNIKLKIWIYFWLLKKSHRILHWKICGFFFSMVNFTDFIHDFTKIISPFTLLTSLILISISLPCFAFINSKRNFARNTTPFFYHFCHKWQSNAAKCVPSMYA